MAFLSVPGWVRSGPRLDARPAFEQDATVAIAWFDLVLDLVRTTRGYSPPVASRAFGYLGLTLYETVVPGLPRRRSLRDRFPGLKLPDRTRRSRRMHWPTAANAAMTTAVRDLFASASSASQTAIDQLEDALRPAVRSDASLLAAESTAWGKEVAAAVVAWSRSDGGHDGHLRNFPPGYVAPEGPGLWVPTPPDFLRALQPYWGANRTFAVESSGCCDSGDHPPYSDDPGSEFYRDAVEVFDAVNDITAEQRTIAMFWSDDPGQTATPPGHSISILNQVAQAEGLDLGRAAECYLRVGFAVSDAFVTCWKTKYRYNLVRPITYIRSHLDEGWAPILSTPPFPEFTSGHSVQSGAAFGVMADLFGDDYRFVDHTHDQRGFVPRPFTSFSGAAEEAAISRLYGGIHFRPAIELGLEQGRCVAAAVGRLPLFTS